MKITEKNFKYHDSTTSAKPGYLEKKWDKLYPGWRKTHLPKPIDPPPSEDVVPITRKKSLIK